MNRKITKTMANEAAAKMKDKVYSKKIDEATAKIDKAIEALVRKYIPSPVIACTNEYSDYIAYSTGASITAIKEYPNGTTRRIAYIKGKLTFKVPTYSNCITVVLEDYEAVRKLQDKKDQIVEQSKDLERRIIDALIALRTEKNVEKELPEAIKYLRFPEVKGVPMPIFAGLREILGKVIDD